MSNLACRKAAPPKKLPVYNNTCPDPCTDENAHKIFVKFSRVSKVELCKR